MLGRKFHPRHLSPGFLRSLVFLSLAAILYVFLPRSCGATVVPADEVWKCAEHLGLQYNIDPLLIFSIACAESSLDASADSGKARGIMQMTPDAWAEVTDRSFREAWDWRENMEEAVCYLQLLKSRLLGENAYSWPVLVASYHYGLGKIEQSDYNLARLPPTKNLIYAKLFKGETPENLPYPAPKRAIEDSPVAFRPDANLLMTLSPSDYPNLPPLLDGSGEPIPDESLAKQGEPIVLPELDVSPAPREERMSVSDGSGAQKSEPIVLPELEKPSAPSEAGPSASEAASGQGAPQVAPEAEGISSEASKEAPAHPGEDRTGAPGAP
jgi:hypothetical protein